MDRRDERAVVEHLVASVPDVSHDLAATSAFPQARAIAGRDRDPIRLRSTHPGLLTFDRWAATAAWPAPTGTR